MAYALAPFARRCRAVVTAIENTSTSTRLYLFCATCRVGEFRWDEKFSGGDVKRKMPAQFAEAIVTTCHTCAAILTLTTKKIPTFFVPEAYRCSPDGSAAAAWIPPREVAPSHWPCPPPPEEPAAEPEPEPDELDDLRVAAQRMRDIIVLHDELRQEFSGNEDFAEELDRIFEAKKRDIKRVDGFDEYDYEEDD